MNEENNLSVRRAPEGKLLTNGIVYASEIMCDKGREHYMYGDWEVVDLGNPEVPDDEVVKEILALIDDDE